MPWWGWLIVGGGLLVWVSVVAIVCLFFKGAKKLNDKWDRDHEEFLRSRPYTEVRRRG